MLPLLPGNCLELAGDANWHRILIVPLEDMLMTEGRNNTRRMD